ncbi:MAG: arginine repressor [Lachnospiraceae bacterium]|nr:arginine repressor [Lachnospiraceae bacterium]
MKQKRQLRIIEIINHNAIETQEELALKLREEGFNVTQATVSRDIRELNLSKVPGVGGRQKYAVLSGGGQPSDKYVRMMHDGLISMEPAGNMLVLKTVSGMAMAVAAAIDAMHFPEIVGSIAGDDTIMAATKSSQEASNLKSKINDLIH